MEAVGRSNELVRVTVPTPWQLMGWVDLGRAHAGVVAGPYTWWSYRGKAFDNDAGWRIDYLLADPRTAAEVHGVTVDKEPSYDVRISDHAPLRARLAL